MDGSQGRIDVHAHYVPDFYREAAVAAGHEHPDGIPAFPDWNPAMAIELMDKVGIATAMLSVSSPGVHFGDDAAARDLARSVNEAGAELVKAHPGRFGLFASLPLPDVEGSLAEIAHAFDELNADGVVLMTNTDGVYPADPKLDAVMAELDRRNAVIFLHPTSPCCGCGQGEAMPYPRPMLEFMFETTRCVADLVLLGTFEKYRNLRLIVPHAGAALPVLADRLQVFGAFMVAGRDGQHVDVLRQLKRFYYDVAGFPLPRQLAALRTFADPAHLFYGSDWPFTPGFVVEGLIKEMSQYLSDNPDLADGIARANAEALFPRLGR